MARGACEFVCYGCGASSVGILASSELDQVGSKFVMEAASSQSVRVGHGIGLLFSRFELGVEAASSQSARVGHGNGLLFSRFEFGRGGSFLSVGLKLFRLPI